MNADQNIDDQPASRTSQPLEMDSNNENLEDNVNPSTPAQRRERMSSLIVLAYLALLTGKIF